jgi:NADPH:quinone reductase
MTPSTMTAAVVARQGAADFVLETHPIPTPGPGQILIRVEASGVNFSDVKRRRGDAYPFPTAFPFVPGGEVAGTVVAHGPGVDTPPVGARVFALAGTNGFGGYAQFAVSYAETAVPLPDALGFDAASTILVAGTTARLILTHAVMLKAGETVLIPAATGGVGTFALQIARHMGASLIIAAVGDSAKAKAALAAGADKAIVYSEPDWPDQVRALTAGRGVDVALEASGAVGLTQTFACLAPFGRLVVYGSASGQPATLNPAMIEAWLYAPAANQQITGFNVGDWFQSRPMEAGAALMALVGDVMSGALKVPPITALPLSKAAEAHQILETRQSRGKLVLKPWY